MTEKPVISLARERDERPDQVAITDIAAGCYAHAQTGATVAVAHVSLLSGGRDHWAAYTGLTRADRMRLKGVIQELLDAISEAEEGQSIERIPGPKD